MLPVVGDQLTTYEELLARDGRVEIRYRWQFVLLMSLLIPAILAGGVALIVWRDSTLDLLMGLLIILMMTGALVGFGLAVARPGPPAYVDHEGVHLRKLEQVDVTWERLRRVEIISTNRIRSLVLDVVERDGSSGQVEVWNMLGNDLDGLTSWLNSRARAPRG
jgi:hypothetical protein